jgi:hypothetical protein
MSDVDKPFECVGERRESAVALMMLAELEQWRITPVVEALAPVAADLVTDAAVADLLTPRDELAFPQPDIAAAVATLLAGGR